MTTSLRVQATVTADGKQASVELTGLTAKVADARIAVDAQKEAARKLSAELRTLNRDTAAGAARAGEIRDQLRAAKIAMIEQGAAAAAASRQMAQLTQATGQAGQSAGQMRSATANLGQQIGDISQGLALGISPMTIFAQQGGQVAFAMSGLGGQMGKVAGFLSGPWGAAITGATIILAPFIAGLFETDKAARTAADGSLTFAQEVGAALRPLSAQAKETFGALVDGFGDAIAGMRGKLPEMRSVISGAFSLVDRINNAASEATGGGFQRSDLAGQYQSDRAASVAFQRSLAVEQSLNTGPLGKGFVDGVATKAGRAYQEMLADVALGTGAVAEATRALNTAQTDLERQVKAGTKTVEQARAEIGKRRAAVEAARDAEQKSTAVTREAAAADREAARDAERYADAQRKLAVATNAYLDAAKAPRAGSLNQGEGLDALGRSTEAIADRLAQGGAVAGDAFADQALTQAVAIGQAIGGSAGAAIRTISGLAQGANSGDYTGVGGALGGALTLLAGQKQPDGAAGPFAEGLKAAVGAPLAGLKDAFKNVFTSENGQAFAKVAGRAAGGAAVGSAVAGIGNAIGVKLDSTGATLGGAVGGALSKTISSLGAVGAALGPFAGVLAGLAGGVLGNLIGVKQGSTTISGSGGKVSTSGAGNSAVQKATGAIGNTITDALQSIAEQLGGSIGDFSVSIGKRGDQFRVDRSGTGKIRGGTVTGTGSESEALSLALADALRDGAVKTSPRVQTALLKYADNVNKAVAEALKVKGLEDLLADRDNPFLAGFRTLESQLKQRIDVARENGFDLVEIERINGEDRARALKDTLAAATGSVRNLLTDLTIGSGATGSPTQRLAGLSAERDRLTGLARGGDTGQLDAIASIIKQIDDLQRETFGATAGFANGRADSVALLNDLIRQTEDRARAAADQARGQAQTTVDKLTELNASADDQVAIATEQKQLLAQIAASLAGGGGAGFALSNEYSR